MGSRLKQNRHRKRQRIRTSYIWAGIMAVGALAALFAAIWVVITVYEKIVGDSSEWAQNASMEQSSEIEIETDEVYGWITEEDGTRYRETDGSFAKDVWKIWEDKLYYLKEDGYMAVEDISMDGQVFFFAEDGTLTDIQLDTGWRGLTGEDNPQNLDSLVKGPEFWCYLYSGLDDTGIFKPIYYRKTTETEERILGSEGSPEMSTRNSMQIHNGYLYYLPQVTSQTLSGLSREEQSLCNKLFRIKPGEARKELLAEHATGYLVLEDGTVYYASERQVKKAGVGTAYSIGESQYRVEVRNDECYLVDAFGNPVTGNENGLQEIGGRVYQLDQGRIIAVSQGEQRYGKLHFTLEPDPQNPGRKVIYKQEEGGQKNLAARAAYGINSFCIAEGMLYYSAYVEQGSDGVRYSELYRMNPDGIEAEQIGPRFEGNILNLYYYEEKRRIYGEYTPVSWKSCYGQIAVIDPAGGKITVIDDSASRGSYGQERNELLSLLMVDDSTVTTYLRTCEYSSSLGTWRVLSEKPYQFTDSKQYDIGEENSEGETGRMQESDQEESNQKEEEDSDQDPENGGGTSEAGRSSTEHETQGSGSNGSDRPGHSDPAVIPSAPAQSSSPAQSSGESQPSNSAQSSGQSQSSAPVQSTAPAQPSGSDQSVRPPQEPGYAPTATPVQPIEMPGPGNTEPIPTVEANPESENGPVPGADPVRFIGPGGTPQ